MKSFTMNTGPGTMLQASMKTFGMGLGDATAKPLVLAFKPTHDGLKAAMVHSNDAGDALILATGECELQKSLALETVETVQQAIEGVVHKDYTDPLYTAAFPDGLTAFKAKEPEQFVLAIPGLVQVLKDSGDDKLKKLVPALEAHVTGFEKPLDGLKKAKLKAASAQLALNRAKVEWLDGYAALEGSFLAAFPRRKRFIASFFPTSSSGSKAKADETAENPATNGAATQPAAGAPGAQA